jgi:hypothetical protein
VPEQLGLDQGLGQRPAVDDDERLAPAAAALVQHPRHQFLAGAALAGDQGRHLAGAHRLHHVQDASDGGRLPDDRGLGLAFGQRHPGLLQLLAHRSMGIDALQLDDQLVDLERLGEVIVGADLQGRHRVRDLCKSGHQDHVHGGPPLAHVTEHGQPVHLGQAHIADDDVDGASIQDRQALCSVAGFRHPVAGVSERFGQGDPQVGFVVYEQHLQRHVRTLPERE